MKSLLPKNPFAAAGIGVLAGLGVAAFKLWSRAQREPVDRNDVVRSLVQHGALFGVVAAAGTVSGKGGSMGLAALSLAGLGQGAAKADLGSLLSRSLGLLPEAGQAVDGTAGGARQGAGSRGGRGMGGRGGRP